MKKVNFQNGNKNQTITKENNSKVIIIISRLELKKIIE